ncbi:gliding motility-associated peptidyl-prolyl isomerase GldI [Aestuariibaculum lutulentum]|uniref:Peptidyl-prolyl cis-trans isomerase n=1 Tax=Aestuariibaculum lutulentum TaxID=2920935 RepID=A0ABS9RME9_9FLAO|nr:gliding motility-associated peptidyl-prolyl isomerase GldI [Aestuariibaculum lutulentum]MCH4553736.1 gliding motility-associated peptidyl-prolyl isomerase GldI [Aestuariibaculum lutulentum]
MNKFLTLAIIALALACKSPEARRPVSVKSGSFIDESVERNKKLNAEEQALIEKFMTQKQENEYIASESGFWYFYNTKTEIDSLQTPVFGDVVNYDFDVKTLNGQTIYSFDDLKTRNYTMDKEELFTGLREGLKLMKTGETVTFLFPSQKAYGYYGDENKIGSNTPLMCKVTLNSITKTEDN